MSISKFNDIYLALGSNMGDRFAHLQQCIDAIFEHIGTISKISSVYQTPAMGFEGDPFLNCVVWVKTEYAAKKVFQHTQKIENALGRVRSTEGGYSARTIDIDLLFYNEEIISTDQLHIPHPRMAERKFVLQPLAEVNSRLKHPVLQQRILKLLATTEDKSKLTKLSKWLRNPRQDFDIARYNYIAIEGNIGAGKTSLATKIAHDFDAKLILERFKDNPFLPKFYQDQQRYAFPLEMSFLADRYQQLLDDIRQFDLFKECVVADYDAYKSLIFAQVTLSEEEFVLYKKLFQMMHKELPKPDIYVYLYQSTERLMENIKKRGRNYETSIAPNYLKQLNKGYLAYMKNMPQEHVKIIDISDLDFVKNRADYLSVLKMMFTS